MLIEEDTYPLELHNFHYAWALTYHDDHIPLDRNYLDRKPRDSSKRTLGFMMVIQTKLTPGGNIAAPNPEYCAWVASK
jgi:hypothetical protein